MGGKRVVEVLAVRRPVVVDSEGPLVVVDVNLSLIVRRREAMLGGGLLESRRESWSRLSRLSRKLGTWMFIRCAD